VARLRRLRSDEGLYFGGQAASSPLELSNDSESLAQLSPFPTQGFLKLDTKEGRHFFWISL
jgi:hypothetical protein